MTVRLGPRIATALVVFACLTGRAQAQSALPACSNARPSPGPGQTIPANAPGLRFRPALFNLLPTAGPNLELLDDAGASLPITFSEDFWLVTLGAPLDANRTYRWRYLDVCTSPTPRVDDPTKIQVEAAFSTTDARPLPTSAGTLVVGQPVRGHYQEGSGIIVDRDVTALPVTLVPSAELQPFLPLAAAPSVKIDGEWVSSAEFLLRAGDVEATRTILVLLRCTASPSIDGPPKVTLGRHNVSVATALPDGKVLSSEAVAVSFRCVESPTSVDLLDPDATVASNTGGCAMGAGGPRPSGALLLFALALLARRRR
jgi:MYXO-CTERM domain-containing protein